MFDIKTGVRQGCILSPFLFLIIIDFIMTKAMDDASFGIEWGQKSWLTRGQDYKENRKLDSRQI